MMGDGCVLHPHAALVPVTSLRLHPLARGGPEAGRLLTVCAQASAAIYDLLERVEAYAVASSLDTARQVVTTLPYRVWRVFPGPERVVTYHMWLAYGDALLRGVLDAEVRAWHPSGRPKISEIPHYDDLAAVADWPARLRRRLAKL